MIKKINFRLVLITILGLLLVVSCRHDEKAKQHLREMKKDPAVSAYELRLAEMSYITGESPDKVFSVGIIKDFIQQQYFTEARYASDHLLGVYGPDPDLYYLKAVCYRNQHEYVLAEKMIRLAVDAKPGDELYMKEDQNVREENKRWQSLDSLNVFLRSDSHNSDLKMKRAGMLLEMREFEAAIYDADSVLRVDSANLNARFIRAIAYLLDKKFEEAQTDFDLLRTHTGSPDYKQYQFYSDLTKSLKKNADLIIASPSATASYVSMARSMAAISEFTTALSILENGLENNPGNRNLRYAKLLIYLQSGNTAEARNLMYSLEGEGVKIDDAVKRALSDKGK